MIMRQPTVTELPAIRPVVVALAIILVALPTFGSPSCKPIETSVSHDVAKEKQVESLASKAQGPFMAGEYKSAEPLLQQTIAAAAESNQQGEVRFRAGANYQLGEIYQFVYGDLDKAEEYYQEALQCSKFMRDFDGYYQAMQKGEMEAELYRLLAALYFEKKKTQGSAAMLESALSFDEEEMTDAATVALAALPPEGPTGTSQGVDASRLWLDTNLALNLLQTSPHDPALITLAVQATLQSKARASDAYGKIIPALRQLYPKEFSDYGRYLSSLTHFEMQLMPSLHNKAPDAEEAELPMGLREELDEAVLNSPRGRVMNPSRLRAPNDARVIESIPKGAALIEFVRYIEYRNSQDGSCVQPWHDSRYYAFVLRPNRRIVAVFIGAGDLVEDNVRLFREELADDKIPVAEVRKSARFLGRIIYQPLEPYLQGADTIFISADGLLELVPFAALIDSAGRYLVQQKTIVELSSGRDLVSGDTRALPQTGPFIVGSPAFGRANRSFDSQYYGRAEQPSDRQLEFHEGDISQTSAEVQVLSSLLMGAIVETGSAATEESVKQVHGPSILHLATHGFYIASDFDPLYSGRDTGSLLHPWNQWVIDHNSQMRCKGSRDTFDPHWKIVPFARVGLALARANEPRTQSGEDGLLTAMEMLSVDLRGTQVAVLSACETGLGELDAAEGVTGLRKALEIAGSETQVISLWNVNDVATRDLMSSFYKGVIAGDGTAAALRKAQLTILRTSSYSHPYFWAAFTHWGISTPIHINPSRSLRIQNIFSQDGGRNP